MTSSLLEVFRMRTIRTRRLLGLRRQPSSKPQTTSQVKGRGHGGPSNGAAQLQLRPSSLLLPSISSYRHPQTSRFENGLYKYTTGIVVPLVYLHDITRLETNNDRSMSIRRTFDATAAAYKVYSQYAFSPSACKDVRDILSAHDNLAPGTSLSSALRFLYHLNAKVYDTIDSVTGVFFQVFRSRGSLRALKLPWTTIPPEWRQWNLYCQTYRNHPGATVCVPSIRLCLTNFEPPVSISGTPWRQHGNSISIQLDADIRPSILKEFKPEENTAPQVAGLSSTGRIQRIVDDILCAMASVTVRTTITDPADLVGKLSSAVTAYLKKSELHSLLDFRSIEIILANPNRSRYVSNVLVNRDGSRRDGRPDEQMDTGTAIKVQGGDGIEGVIL